MRHYTEQEMYRVLGKEMQVSETVEERLSQTYQQIRAQRQPGRAHSRRLWCGAAGTAAAMLAAGIFCVSNPALAAQIPLIGHLFEQIGSDVSYPGDYSGVGTPLVPETETDGGEQAAAYTQSANGMTVTLSEVYCNETALYVTMQLKTEEPMTDHLAMWNDGAEPILDLRGEARFGYNDAPVQLMAGELSGKLADDCTYLGMYRLELAESLTDYSEFYKTLEEQGTDVMVDAQVLEEYGDLIRKNELPEQFDVSISIDQIVGYRKDPVSIYEAAGVEVPDEETIEQMSDEEFQAWQNELAEKVPDYEDYPSKYENYWYDGPFAFDLSVQVDHDRTITVPVDEDAGDGFAVFSVTRTPFELLIENNAVTVGGDAILQVLDADGRRMSTGSRGGSENMLPVDGHDVSRIDIYRVSWEDFEGRKIKGSYFDEHETNEDGQTLKEVLDGCSLYHREVVLEK